MKNKANIIVFTIAGLLLLGLTVFVFFYSSLVIYPKNSKIINQPRPKVSIDWPYAFGARLNTAKVWVDNQDYSSQINKTPRGFQFFIPKNLSDGNHVISAELDYNFVYNKKVTAIWNFNTDTMPPQIKFDEGKVNNLASKTDKIIISGQTEPRSKVTLKLNDEKNKKVWAKADGRFKVTINNLEKKNKLMVTSKDQAGNRTYSQIPVIIDNLPPGLTQITPAANSISVGSITNFSFKLIDESQVNKIDLLVDGKPVTLSYNPAKKIASANVRALVDGKHQAEVTLVDVAKNVNKKVWAFNVDTTRLIIRKSTTTLYIYKRDQLIKTVKVALGQASWPTPSGSWKIMGKDELPTWYNPHRSWSASMPETISPGPSNPLGLRAMYLDADAIAIHGTSATWSIGTFASHGCIRVANSDVVEIFPLVPVGAPVEIMD